MLSPREHERRTRNLERAAGSTPLWVPPLARIPLPFRLRITGGKALGYGGLTGVKYTSVTAAASTIAMDPNVVAGGADDGFGWATNVHTDEKVLVCTARVVVSAVYRGGGVISFDLPVDTEVIAWRTFLVPGPAASTLFVYDVWMLG